MHFIRSNLANLIGPTASRILSCLTTIVISRKQPRPRDNTWYIHGDWFKRSLNFNCRNLHPEPEM